MRTVARMAIYALIAVLASAFLSHAADVTISWDPSEGAKGYKVYMSVDLGKTWAEVANVTDRTTVTISSVPDKGLVLFRASSYNDVGTFVRSEAGAWYNGDWKPVKPPSQLGLK